MASVHRHTGTPYWHGAFRMPDGRRVQRSTKTKDKSKAIQIALGWERAAQIHACKDQAARVLSDIVKAVGGAEFEQATVHAFAARWVEAKKLETSQATADRYASVCKRFVATLPETTLLRDLTSSMLARYRDAEAGRTTPASANMAIKILRMMLKDALHESLIADNPATKVRALNRVVVQHDEQARRVFTLEETLKVLDACRDDDEWTGIVLCGFYTGQRLGDVVRAHTRQIKGPLWEFSTCKTGRSMHVPLHPRLLEWIEAKPRTGFLFPVQHNANKSSLLSNRFYQIMTQAGLVPKRSHNAKADGTGRDSKRTRNPLSYHCFRHTLTTMLKAKGVSESVAMEFVGHDSPDINRNYTHMPMSSLQEAMQLLPTV